MNKTLVGTEESAGAVIRRCSGNTCAGVRKTPVLKFQALRPATWLKSDSSKGVFPSNEIFNNTYFVEYLLAAASELVRY